MRTLQEARSALDLALEDVDPDNPVGAVRVVAKVARDFHAEAPTTWDAFRHVATEMVAPYFERRASSPAKAAAWAVVDPYFGQLMRGEVDDVIPLSAQKRARVPDDVRAALTGRAR